MMAQHEQNRTINCSTKMPLIQYPLSFILPVSCCVYVFSQHFQQLKETIIYSLRALYFNTIYQYTSTNRMRPIFNWDDCALLGLQPHTHMQLYSYTASILQANSQLLFHHEYLYRRCHIYSGQLHIYVARKQVLIWFPNIYLPVMQLIH